MVARGDLGVEIPYRKVRLCYAFLCSYDLLGIQIIFCSFYYSSQVFAAQKMMVEKCNAAGKPVIVATQMLDSMQRHPRQTRAEVTDVGTAVLDGADAVMLSGETAAGAYPIESIKAMKMIVKADDIMDKKPSLNRVNPGSLIDISNIKEDQCLHAVAGSSVRSARELDVKLIILITKSGKVARFVSADRPTVPVLTFCTDVQVARRLQLHRGIFPIMLQTDVDPLAPGTRMATLRAEAMRTAA
jgi:pyruvate kinase